MQKKLDHKYYSIRKYIQFNGTCFFGKKKLRVEGHILN
jgi:hypothetical protein